ncbi:MAG: hypothetical protein ACREJG_00580 [Candidatus Rokuibacteriota bacterium]
MLGRRRIGHLAGVAAHLTAAHDELARAGFDTWADEIEPLLAIIAAEISWLERDGDPPA